MDIEKTGIVSKLVVKYFEELNDDDWENLYDSIYQGYLVEDEVRGEFLLTIQLLVEEYEEIIKEQGLI